MVMVAKVVMVELVVVVEEEERELIPQVELVVREVVVEMD
jgi:hypothetical protein